MSNKKQVEIIQREDVLAWNRYVAEQRKKLGFGFSIDLQGADLRFVDLQGADLQGAVLRGARVNSVKVDDNWQYTDLSKLKNLTQEQLDEMDGDSGTLIPKHLTRPAHWPKIDHKPKTPDIISKIAAHSPVEYGIRNGRIYGGDRPLGGKPPKDNPQDLKQRWAALKTLLKDTQDEAKHAPRNFDVDLLLRLLERLQRVLEKDPENWYELDDAISAIRRMMANDDDAKHWSGGVVDYLHELINRAAQLEALLRPAQEAPPEHPMPEPQIEGKEEQIKQLQEELKKLSEDENLSTVAEKHVIDDLSNHANNIEEAQNQPDITPEQSVKKKNALLHVLKTLFKRVAALMKVLTSDKAVAFYKRVPKIIAAISAIWKLIEPLIK